MSHAEGRRRFTPRVWQHDWHHLTRLRRGVEAALARHGLPGSDDVVVDFGCGDRPYQPLFDGWCRKYLTCDLDGDVDVRITPGQPLDLPAKSVDGVVSFQVLEHVWDLDWYLGECRRILKPGGWLLLSTHGTWLYHPHPTDFRRWTRDGLCRELTDRGFDVAGVEPVVGPLAWTTQFRLLGYNQIARKVPVLGPALFAPLAVLMNLRILIEDGITPPAIRDVNASVYVTVSRPAAADSRPVRVLLVTHFYPSHPGGIERIAWELARRLPRHGVELTWAATATGDLPVGVRCLPARGWNVAEDHLGFPYPLWHPLDLLRTARAARVADVVFLQDSLYLGNVVAAAAARRLIVTQHVGLVPYKNPILRSLMAVANRTVARWVLGRADRVALYNRLVGDYFGRFVRFRRKPLFLPNGVDTDRFHPPLDRAAVRAELGWPADRPVLLLVGRFVEKKGLGVLREVAARLPECDFAFAGWGPLDPGGWGLRNVRVAGSLTADRLVPLYQAADLLVLPSVGEGFPLVVQEAMACGTPALISDETAAGYPGAEEWAVVAKPEPGPVAEAIRAVLADPEGLTRRRGQVAAFARSEWDWDRCAAAYTELFRELVNPAAGSRATGP